MCGKCCKEWLVASPVACSALMSAYCASCLHIANEALLHRRRQVASAGNLARGGKLVRNRCSSSSCSPAPPLHPLPLLSRRSQNFKPTQNVDPFLQEWERGKRQAGAGTQSGSGKPKLGAGKALKLYFSCFTYPLPCPTPPPCPRWGISVLTSFPNFSRSWTLSLMSHVAQWQQQQQQQRNS